MAMKLVNNYKIHVYCLKSELKVMYVKSTQMHTQFNSQVLVSTEKQLECKYLSIGTILSKAVRGL